MANQDIDRIKTHLKGLKSQLEQDLHPIKIKTIVIETSSLLKVSIIEDNIPIIRRTKKSSVSSSIYQDKAFLKNTIREMNDSSKAIKAYFLESQQYEEASKMRAIEKSLIEIEEDFGKFDK